MSILEHKRTRVETSGATPRGFRIDAERPLALLSKCPAHAKTPIHKLDALAQESGLASLLAKDESQRMGLGSFKALGGAYAVAQMICDAAGVEHPMDAPDVAAKMTFVTASAGNHGLSVAVGARIFGAKAAIVLPKTAPRAFTDRIRVTGAQLHTGGSYDESVAEAIRLADEHGWLHLSDGSWAGYEERPALVLEGYAVLADECRTSFEQDDSWPTHVFLQAGVGGLAAAVAAHIREYWIVQPQIVVVEPERAACLQKSIKAEALVIGDGPDSNMGRLDCKNASKIAFEALRRDADIFVTITDDAASAASEKLAQHGIETTPSGAAGFAGLTILGLGTEHRAMIIISEGPELGLS